MSQSPTSASDTWFSGQHTVQTTNVVDTAGLELCSSKPVVPQHATYISLWPQLGNQGVSYMRIPGQEFGLFRINFPVLKVNYRPPPPSLVFKLNLLEILPEVKYQFNTFYGSIGENVRKWMEGGTRKSKQEELASSLGLTLPTNLTHIRNEKKRGKKKKRFNRAIPIRYYQKRYR